MGRESVGTRGIVAPPKKKALSWTKPDAGLVRGSPKVRTIVDHSTPVAAPSLLDNIRSFTRANAHAGTVTVQGREAGGTAGTPSPVVGGTGVAGTGNYTGSTGISTAPVVPVPVEPSAPGPEAPGTGGDGASTGDQNLDNLNDADLRAMIDGILAESGLTEEQLLASDTAAANLYKVLRAKAEVNRLAQLGSVENSYAARGFEKSGLLAKAIGEAEQNYQDLVKQYAANQAATLQANAQTRESLPDVVAGRVAQATRLTEDEAMQYIEQMNALAG